MTENKSPKTMPDRDAVLRAIQAHLGDGCYVHTDTGQKEWCPYNHDVSCETKLLWDIYDLLSPKPLTHTKSDGEYRYGRCPVCDKAVYQNVSRPDTVKFCYKCGTSFLWPSAKK